MLGSCLPCYPIQSHISRNEATATDPDRTVLRTPVSISRQTRFYLSKMIITLLASTERSNGITLSNRCDRLATYPIVVRQHPHGAESGHGMVFVVHEPVQHTAQQTSGVPSEVNVGGIHANVTQDITSSLADTRPTHNEWSGRHTGAGANICAPPQTPPNLKYSRTNELLRVNSPHKGYFYLMNIDEFEW